MSSKVIILEGVDKVGKTTIMKTLHEITDHRYVIVDRFTGSNLVYGIFRKRKMKVEDYFNIEKELAKTKTILPVYLIASKKEIVKRIRRHQEEDIMFKDIDPLMLLYKKYLLKTPFDYFCLDTTYKTPSQCALMIYDEILRREKDE